MADVPARPLQAGSDLRRMRGVTTASLATLVLIGGFLQIVLGFYAGFGARMLLLIVATVVSVILALALVPSLLRPPGGALSRQPLALALISVACLTWILALVPPFFGWGWGFLLAVAGGMLSCVVSSWRRAAALVGTIGMLVLGVASASWASSASPAGPPDPEGAGSLVIVGTLVLMTFSPLSTVWVLRVAVRLDDARRTATELAVATERLRFATDLHDIQGHHLQVIALKGELAERRLLAGEVTLATVELSDIRKLAQTALEDTRAVVNDYRTVTLAVEARNAADVLRSAGIDCTARIDVSELPTGIETVFAVAIREATTNILRHSAATTATLDLVRSASGGYRLTVTNDAPGPMRAGGSGIAGLLKRASDGEGTVHTERREGTFTLTVCMPAHVPREREDER